MRLYYTINNPSQKYRRTWQGQTPRKTHFARVCAAGSAHGSIASNFSISFGSRVVQEVTRRPRQLMKLEEQPHEKLIFRGGTFFPTGHILRHTQSTSNWQIRICRCRNHVTTLPRSSTFSYIKPDCSWFSGSGGIKQAYYAANIAPSELPLVNLAIL